MTTKPRNRRLPPKPLSSAARTVVEVETFFTAAEYKRLVAEAAAAGCTVEGLLKRRALAGVGDLEQRPSEQEIACAELLKEWADLYVLLQRALSIPEDRLQQHRRLSGRVKAQRARHDQLLPRDSDLSALSTDDLAFSYQLNMASVAVMGLWEELERAASGTKQEGTH